ncbi:ABC transporter permease [Streptomyces sp. NPDC001663]|uniref:ABC transporter permease n=1 Tax=Streptomyces sp. NPDC001663 TaxID=3364597 RepID=UPI0036982408
MTALGIKAPAMAPVAGGSRGLPAVLLRLHRPALITWAVLVALTSALLLWAHGPGDDAAHAEWLRTCGPGVPCTWSSPIVDYYRARTLAEAVIAVLPLPIAAWAGAALTGRELESGTARLAWTQSVSPARWLTAKLALPAALITVGSAVLVLLHHLMATATPFPYDWQWRDATDFPLDGALALAHPLLGLTVGALAGLLLGRSLPALFAAVAGTEAVLVTPGYLRYEYPESHFWPLGLVETRLALAAVVAAAAVVIAFRLLRRSAV